MEVGWKRNEEEKIGICRIIFHPTAIWLLSE